MHVEHRRGELLLTTDPDRMDLEAIHGFLSGESYWAQGIPRETVERAVRHSLCFGVLEGERQVAFARVVTDRATYGYLCDVYVVEGHRGRGIGTWLLESIVSHPDLQGLRRWGLVTRDAHRLYSRFGFARLAWPQGYMERLLPEPYAAAARTVRPPPLA